MPFKPDHITSNRLLRHLLQHLLLTALLLTCSVAVLAQEALRIGSKRFTESYVLGEVLTQTAAPYAKVEHKQGLGNTAIVLAALKAGEIDLYPEYLGTIDREVLKHDQSSSSEAMQRELAARGLGIAIHFGFNNTYALAMRAADSERLSINSLADLAAHPGLRLGLSHEFLGRADGWSGLARRYRLPQQPQGLDHGLAYTALEAGQIDVIDIYSTDAKIGQLHLRVLDDSAGYFPRYDAVVLYRLESARRFPAAWAALQKLQGRIDETRMSAMNAEAEAGSASFADVARRFLRNDPSYEQKRDVVPARSAWWRRLVAPDLARLTRQHLALVAGAVVLASLVGIPLGVAAAYRRRLRHLVLGAVNLVQTIPSLALLAMLIPLLGRIGQAPALLALFVYALLPIVANACAGVAQVPEGLRLAATALGMGARDRILTVELPLALPVILAGVKTAAVISVGTATIAAFVGAGGFGERIVSGLALNDYDMLLSGALPAAVLALVTQAGFELFEYFYFARRRAPADGNLHY